MYYMSNKRRSWYLFKYKSLKGKGRIPDPWQSRNVKLGKTLLSCSRQLIKYIYRVNQKGWDLDNHDCTEFIRFVSLHSGSPATVNLFFFFAESLYKSLDYYISGQIRNLTLGSLHFQSFQSSFQSHPLWVTLY